MSKPLDATYTLNNINGYANGTVTVTMGDSELSNRAIVMYWADANGKLNGYTSLARFKVTGKETTFTFTSSMVIPNGATRLLLHAQNTQTGVISEEYISIDLPESSAMGELGNKTNSIWIISDIHIGRGDGTVSAENFKKMLNTAVSLNPEGIAIFIVGDMADGGTNTQFEEMMSLHAQVMEENGKDASKYPLFLTLGNHDYPSMTTTFLEYAKLPNGENPTDTSYDFWLNGYHYIFLGSDVSSGLYATLNEETLLWLDEKLNECRDESRPTFVFLHQPMYNTVSGSLPGENWNGVNNEEALRAVLKKYPEVMFFNGHTHWTMDSVGNIFEGTEELPIHIFNCASVSYLWSGFNTITGSNLDGSQGYYVEMYDGKVFVRGRDFITNEWISSAQYLIQFENTEGDGHTYNETVTYENGYTNNGKLTRACTVCGEIIETTTLDPLFTCLGYSVAEYTDGIAVGFSVNHDAIDIFEEATGSSLSYGVFVVREDKLKDNDIFDANGNKSTGVASADLTDYGFVAFELKLINFSEDHKSVSFAMGAYVKVGTEYSYIQAGTRAENDKYVFTTYNEVTK